MNTWIVATEPRRIYGMLAAARPVSEKITIAFVGSAAGAEEVAVCGADRVVNFVIDAAAPAESAAAAVAAAAAADGANLVLGNDGSESRSILGACAGTINAAVLGAVQTIAADGAGIVAGNKIAAGKAVEEVACAALVGIYTGPDADAAPVAACAIETVEGAANGDVISGFEAVEGTGLDTASRVVGVGLGIGGRDNLPLMEGLAAAMGAEMACTLPCCDDMHWFPSERVLGSSHHSAAPDLYVCAGISGSPNHTSGVTDSKVIVAINNNPDAEIFGVAKYGIVGDLNEIVPALTAAFQA